MSALDHQESGSHYKDLAIQPAEFFFANGVGKLEGDIIQYVLRWRAKNGLEDLRKARHTLDILIELEEARQAKEREAVMHSGSRFSNVT